MANTTPPLTARERIDVLLEEYRALYGLVLFRLGALERRVPIAAGTAVAVLASLASLPEAARLVVLIALPIGILWFVRTTINHARSFEDALRRIDSIERRVNTIAADSLLEFQSRHPSRGRTVGGRTGRETIRAVLAGSLTALGGAGAVTVLADLVPHRAGGALMGFYVVVGAMLLLEAWRLRRYRYHAEPDEQSPAQSQSTRTQSTRGHRPAPDGRTNRVGRTGR